MAVVNPRSSKKRSTRGWYTISVETLRKLVFFTILAIAAGVAFAVFRSYERRAVEREAAALIAEVGDLLSRAQIGRASCRERV